MIRSCSNSAVEEMNKKAGITIEITSKIIEETTKGLGKVIKCTEDNVENIVKALLNGSEYYWNSDLISDKFRLKYHDKYSIIENIDDYKHIGCGKVNLPNELDNYISVGLLISDDYVKEYDTNIEINKRRYYKYNINDKNQLDDLNFVYERIRSIIAITGERTDGKKEATTDEVPELLHYIANPYHDFDFVYTHNYTEEAMPYSDICQIVNRPDLNKLGIPDNSYHDFEDGKYYIIFEYADKVIKYKVDYKVNWDFF